MIRVRHLLRDKLQEEGNSSHRGAAAEDAASERAELVRELEIEGHAQTGPRGGDILCAAVSVLAENLEDALEVLARIRVEVEKRDGYHRLRIDRKDLTREAALLLAAACLGLRRLAEQHPERMQYTEKPLL